MVSQNFLFFFIHHQSLSTGTLQKAQSNCLSPFFQFFFHFTFHFTFRKIVAFNVHDFHFFSFQIFFPSFFLSFLNTLHPFLDNPITRLEDSQLGNGPLTQTQFQLFSETKGLYFLSQEKTWLMS